MFLDSKQELFEIYSPFSWKYIKHVLCSPEIYFCTSISDFIKNQENIIPTSFKLFKPGKNYQGMCLVCFSSSYYKKRVDDLDRKILFDELIAKEEVIEQGIQKIETEEDFHQLEEKIINLWRKELPKIAEADLYDLAENSLHLNIGGDNVPEGKIYDVIILYAPSTTFSFMLSYETHSRWPRFSKKKKELRSLVNILQPQLK